MYISTSSEVFLNRIPSSRVSWYLDMSFGNDFFFKKTCLSVSLKFLIICLLWPAPVLGEIYIVMVYVASDGLFVTYQRTNFNPMLIIKCIFQPPARSFSTGYQALGYLGILICPLRMTFSSKKLKNASTQIF